MKLRSSLLAATALTATLVMTPAAAHAQTGTRSSVRDANIDRVKTRCLAAIDRRQQALVHLDDVLANRSNLTDAHHTALKQINDQTSSGLTGLANKIQGDTTGDQLRADCHAIVSDYRVFVLVRPRAHLVVAGDRELAAVEKLHDVETRIQNGIDKAKAKGKDTSKAQAELATVKTQTDSAAQHAGAVYNEVIGLTPASWSPGVLTPGRNDAKAAHDAIVAAAQAAHAAVNDLKS